MRVFKCFRVWVAVLLVAVAAWAQSGQILNMDDLKAQIAAFNAGNSDMSITIGADFNITSPLEINNYGYTLTLQSLTSPPRKLTRAAMDTLIIIRKGSLTLQNITIDGNKASLAYATNARGSLIFVGDGGILNMLEGTTLQNNVSDDNGSGVYVYSRGKFNMSGGTITGNKTNGSGGGVYIYALRATFNMSGGIITNDTCGTSATSYSGGVHFANTPFATDTDPDKTASVFRLGGTAVIKDNAKGNGSSSNVYMAGSRYITLGDGTDGVPAPTGGMEVWITKVAEHGLFVNKGAKPPNPPDEPFGDAKYFQADAGSQIYYLEVGKLAMQAGYDISLEPGYLKFMEISGYETQPEHEITVTNSGGTIGKLTIYLSGEQADKFELDLANISNSGMIQYAKQKFTVKPKLGLEAGEYSAFVLVSATEDLNGVNGSVIMRRLDVDFLVREYVEDRTLYFNQSDGKFYASNAPTKIDSLPSPNIFVPANEIRIPASWDSETNTLKLYGVNWTTNAPYSLYFSQPTPVTLELAGNNSFVSNNAESYSTGIVSRSSLAITGGGSLEAKGGNYGLFTHALTINSGTFTAFGGTTAIEIDKDVVLRTPPDKYKWWYPNPETIVSGAFANDPNYKWIKIEVPPPDYELGATVNNNEPFVDEEIEITLTVKDITTGDIYKSLPNNSYKVDLTGIQPSVDFDMTSGSNLTAVPFNNGVGKINMKLRNTGAQILHFSLDNPAYPAINPIVITPLPKVMPPDKLPSILLHPDDATFPNAIYGYPAQTPLNFIIENRDAASGHPTGELKVTLSGDDSKSFTISSDKVSTIATGGSTILKITPILGLDAKTYTATVIVSGDRIAENKTLAVSFKVGKAPGAKVATPTLADETAKGIFIYSIPKPSTGQEVEYAIGETSDANDLEEFVTFGSSLSILEFSGLPTTTKYIFARSKENANYEAGAISEPLQSCIPFNEIAVALWGNNTLTVINNSANNVLGLKFDDSDYTWFLDGEITGVGQSLSKYENGEQLPSGKYHVEITNQSGKFISCEYKIEPPADKKASPINSSDIETTDVYSISGKRLDRLNAQDLILKSKTGSKKTIKVTEVPR